MDNYLVIDDFLDDFDAIRDHCDGLEFYGQTNPLDGVFYPGVDIDIPESVKNEVMNKLERKFGVEIDPGIMFMRLSTEGIEAPHQAHTDFIMGRYSMMLYLNRNDDCLGGTSLVCHKESGLCENPINKKQEEIWEKDTNNPDAWSILNMCSMKPNRAMIFDSKLMHRSEPIGGFGNDATNGRLVLTFFFGTKS